MYIYLHLSLSYHLIAYRLIDYRISNYRIIDEDKDDRDRDREHADCVRVREPLSSQSSEYYIHVPGTRSM